MTAVLAFPAKADLLKDYSHIRGNHYFGWQQDEATIRKELGWVPQYPDLRSIIQSAWNWHVKHPNGDED